MARARTHAHTYTQTRTSLNRGSACSRDLYLHDTQISQRDRSRSMHPGGFEPKIPASERLQTYALDRAPLGPRRISLILYIILAWIKVGETWLMLTNFRFQRTFCNLVFATLLLLLLLLLYYYYYIIIINFNITILLLLLLLLLLMRFLRSNVLTLIEVWCIWK